VPVTKTNIVYIHMKFVFGTKVRVKVQRQIGNGMLMCFACYFSRRSLFVELL
jgi:hypothetical protein